MVIKPSSGKAIDSLIADLASDEAVRRQTAVARLTVIGARAVDRLINLAADGGAASSARVGALRTLEHIADARALEPALDVFTDPDSAVAIAALGVARAFLRTPRGVKALDRVTAVALDHRRPGPVRLAAIHALSDLSAATTRPILAALKSDPDPEIADALATGMRPGGVVAAKDRQQAAADGPLPSDPAALRRAIGRSAAGLSASALQQIVERVRVREGTEPASRRLDWMSVRGAAHAALARRGSRVALYDLREAIETARQPLPGEFLTALTAVGDASCLEPIAAAYARALSDELPDDWWQRHLADAFRLIARREKITRGHAVIKRIEKRWKAALDELWPGRTGKAR